MKPYRKLKVGRWRFSYYFGWRWGWRYGIDRYDYGFSLSLPILFVNAVKTWKIVNGVRVD